MPRPKPQVVYGPPGATLEDIRRTLQRDINALIATANLFVMSAPDSTRRGAEVHQVLQCYAEGRAHRVTGWPARPAMALLNLVSNVRTGDYHLRRCVECTRWMLVKNAKREICLRPACHTTKNTKTRRKNRRYR